MRILEAYNDDSEIEVEIYEADTDMSIDSSFDIGFQDNEALPILTVSMSMAKE